MLYLIGVLLAAAFVCLLIGAFTRSQRRQRKFVLLCAALLVPSLILSSVAALMGQSA